MGKHVSGRTATRSVAAAAVAQGDLRLMRWAGAGVLILGVAGLALQARAEDAKVITAHGISTFGNLKYPANFTPDYVNPDAPKGGEISEWAFGTFDSMNPFTVKGVPGVGSSGIYETVLTGTADEIGASYCLLCTTMDYPEDRSWVIFHLRDDVKFWDGKPMTAADVIFTFEQFRDHGLSDFRDVFNSQVASAEAIDDHTVKFTFKPDFPTRDLPATVGSLPVFEKADFEANKRSLEDSSLDVFMGSGPYKLGKTVPGQTITYVRDPNYWGKDLPINKGQNNFDTIRYEYFGDSQAAFEAFKGGAYTFRVENSSKSWATQYDFPAVKDGTVVKAELPNGNIADGQAFLFNLRREKFQDPRVREAIGLMFNFEWSNQTLFYGLYQRINAVWENSWMAATGAPSDAEKALLQPLVDQKLLDPSILTDDAVMAPVSSADTQLDRGNLRKASKLLDDAGWIVGDDGIRKNAKGEKLSVEFLNDNPAFDRIINPYVENLKALGVDATLADVDPAQSQDREAPPKYDFDIITGNAGNGYEPGADLLQEYGSKTADNTVFNEAGLKNPAVDALITKAIAAKTRGELDDVTKALDRVLRATRFWVPQWYKNKYTVAYYDEYDHPATLPPYALGELSFWWYDADKAAKLKAAGALK
jgi:microcin C transport system substrate-binding protein